MSQNFAHTNLELHSLARKLLARDFLILVVGGAGIGDVAAAAVGGGGGGEGEGVEQPTVGQTAHSNVTHGE